MKAHGLLLARHGGGAERRHDGRVAVPERNTRWCSDGFEIGCDNGERVRIAFALDCCDDELASPKIGWEARRGTGRSETLRRATSACIRRRPENRKVCVPDDPPRRKRAVSH
jgi:transposase InsO family protein